jgi:hypothetical protein
MAAKLKLIDTCAPPRPLGQHGRALWNRITCDYDISDAAGIPLQPKASTVPKRSRRWSVMLVWER